MRLSQSSDVTVLAVDLDGTLIKTDMLHESFWGALSRDYRTPFLAVGHLMRGKAHLKQALARRSDLDVSTLPYDQKVIDYVEAWKARGGRTALVTASDIVFATAVAEHLGLFDEVHASDGSRNLKGQSKADFLVERFGHGKFGYMGDHESDLLVWKSAGQVVGVGPSGGLRKKLRKLHEGHELIERDRRLKPYIRAIRPHQWLKNVLILLPFLAGHAVSINGLGRALLAFFAFSLIASSVYVLNDLLDLNSDRAHPRKRLRPLASGDVPISHGAPLTLGLFAVGTLLSILLGWQFCIVMAAYYGLTLGYSLVLKRRAIVDICALAMLYTLRIVAGGVATGTPLSVWLLAFALFFFFALATVKRQAELVDAANTGRLKAHGRGYWPSDLAIVSQMATAAGFVSVLVLTLYVNSNEVTTLYHRPQALWGICIVILYWISRIIMITHRGHMHDDPIVFAAKDRNSYVCGVLVLLFVALAL